MKKNKYGTVVLKQTIQYEFDANAEYERIMKSFKGKERANMLKVLDLFCQGRILECRDFIDGLVRAKGGYPEAEHIGVGLFELITRHYGFSVKLGDKKRVAYNQDHLTFGYKVKHIASDLEHVDSTCSHDGGCGGCHGGCCH